MMLENIILDELTGDQREIAECIGIEAYRLLVLYYGGNTVYVAQPTSLIKPDRNDTIYNEYKNGMSIRELTKKYGLCVSSIRQIVSKKKKPTKQKNKN